MFWRDNHVSRMSKSTNTASDVTHCDVQQLFAKCDHGAAKERISSEWKQAIPILTDTLSHHWSTGQGTRVRHVLWSLYTSTHLINLCDACSGLDAQLAQALSAAISARLILGPVIEESLGEVLKKSGEFIRFDQEEKNTPDHLPVIYPPAASDGRTFRKLADSLDCMSRRRGISV